LAVRGCDRDRDRHILACLPLPALETLSVQMDEYLTSGYATSRSPPIRIQHHRFKNLF
jgi:hypothetical protein